MQLETFIINAFTDKPFSGNPAGVCLLNTKMDVETMQAIASELDLSETAFLLKEDNDNEYSIRYFTPTVEIDFCGHATLASAKLVLDKLEKENVQFTTQKGLVLSASIHESNIKMIFPTYKTIEYQAGAKLFEAFGIENHLSTVYCKEMNMLIIEVNNKQQLLAISPNFQKAIESSNEVKEVVITTKSEDDKYDFYSRCFCPWIGIDEDPVTGSSHSVLAKYWGEKLNKKEMTTFQLSKRGGFMNLRLLDNEKLEVCSNAQIVFEGIMNI